MLAGGFALNRIVVRPLDRLPLESFAAVAPDAIWRRPGIDDGAAAAERRDAGDWSASRFRSIHW